MATRQMSRRDVLRLGAAGGTVIVVGGVAYTLANRGSTPSGPAASPAPDSSGSVAHFDVGELEGAVVVTDAAKIPKQFHEAPALAQLVSAGSLPAVADRIGQDPLVLKPVHDIGK